MSSSPPSSESEDMLGPYCYLCDKEELPTSPTEDELLFPSCCLNRNAGCRTCLLQWMYTCWKNRRSYTCPFCRSPPTVPNDILKMFDVDELTWNFLNRQNCTCCIDCGYWTFEPTWVGNQICLLCFDLPVKDSYGRVNIRYTIRRTEVLRERRKLRDQKYQECMDQDSYYRNASAWLFLPDGAVRTLHQLSRREDRKQRCIQVEKECWEQTLHAAWLFLPTGRDVRAMLHLVMKDDSEVRTKRLKRRMKKKDQERRRKEYQLWLDRCQEEWRNQQKKRQEDELKSKNRFAQTKERERSAFYFYQERIELVQRVILRKKRREIRREREERRSEIDKEYREKHHHDFAWLLLHSGADFRAMNQLFVRAEIRKIRQDWRRDCEYEYNFQNNLHAKQEYFARCCQEEWRNQMKSCHRDQLERKNRYARTKEQELSKFVAYQQLLDWKQRISTCRRRKEIRREREERRNQIDQEYRERDYPISSWLFLRSGLDVKTMSKLVDRYNVREICKNNELEYVAQNDVYTMFPGEYCICCERHKAWNCDCDSMSSWEWEQYAWFEREEAYLQKNVWIECMANKWMGERGQPAKKSRGGRKSSKSRTSRTNESTAQPNARWRRRQGNLAWSQDENTFHLSSVSYPRSILC